MMTNNSEALSYIVKDLYNESNPLLNDTFDLIKKMILIQKIYWIIF